VVLGLRDNEYVGVTSGLMVGDEIIARAGTFVSDGDAVTAVRDAELVGATN
jgi:HlyD family secretion protein